MGEVFGLIYGIVKLIPILDKAVRDFLVFYAKKQVEWFNEEVKVAVEKAIATGETRDVENTVNSPRAGKPSGNSGVDYSDPDSPK